MIKRIPVLLLLGASAFADQTFVHPGMLHKTSDLERMRYGIESGMEPWASSFEQLKDDSASSYEYAVCGDPGWTVVGRENPPIHKRPFENDMRAAYQNALMWTLTDDRRHADKAIEILNTWSGLQDVSGIPLNGGIYGWLMLNAAELIRYTDAGWKEEDIARFEAMLFYPGYSATEPPVQALKNDQVSFYWKCYVGDAGRAGNQDASAYMTVMAIGIFTDDQRIYDRGLRYVQGLPHRPDDLPYPSGPHEPTDQIGESPFQISYRYRKRDDVADYGFDGVVTNYIYDTGQCAESSRDQSHPFLGIHFLCQMAEMAWNQGDDLYGLADNRILLGLEYSLRYNVSYVQPYPDQRSPWEPRSFYKYMTRSGRTKSLAINPHAGANEERISRGQCIGRNIFELPLCHYKQRAGLPAEKYKWLQRIRDLSIEKTGGFETRDRIAAPGWGALAYYRPKGCSGDPISGILSGLPVFGIPALPAVIEAENYDWYPTEGEGSQRTYFDRSSGNSGRRYRVAEDVDIAGSPETGYFVGDLEKGEWLKYTVYIPRAADYDITVRYASEGEVALSLAFNEKGVVKGAELAPTGSFEQWGARVVGTGIALEQGVQCMLLYIANASGSCMIDNISITAHAAQDLTVVEPFEKESVVDSVVAESANEVTVTLKDGRRQVITIEGLDKGEGINATIQEFKGGQRIREEVHQ